jgi:hypothetical protein
MISENSFTLFVPLIPEKHVVFIRHNIKYYMLALNEMSQHAA